MTSPIPSNDPAQLAALFARAVQAAGRDDKEAAIGLLKELVEADPRHEVGTGMLASLYAELGLAERAQDLYRQLLAHHPGNPLARLQLGVLQLGQGLAAEALETLRPMLAAQDDFLAHFYSGMAQLTLGRPAEARPLLQAAAGRMPPAHPLQEHLQPLLDATD